MATKEVESWDDDLELQGPILTQTSTTRPGSISSRLSFRSESNAAEDDWHVPIASNDQQSINNAISSAKQAGIPIPSNVPSSALLGGTIKRLGKQRPAQNTSGEDWGDDIEIPDKNTSPLKIKPPALNFAPVAFENEPDDLDWAEGSLGVRFGGTGRASKHRSSSASAMSPSATSGVTLESEEDGLGGIVLPSGPIDFETALRKRKDVPAVESGHTVSKSADTIPRPTANGAAAQKEDFFTDIDFGTGDVFDPRKITLNRNVRQSWKPPQTPSPAWKTQASLTFTDKAAGTRIPRPVMTPKSSRLEPVYETGATNITKSRRPPEPATTTSQLLRSKRSMPALRPQPTGSKIQSPGPVQPTIATASASRATANAGRPSHGLRRDSDPFRPQSPNFRMQGRLSNDLPQDTPTRQRRDVAPAALVREAAAKRTITRPTRRRNYGDGTELDTFDDLPTSAAKESLYVKPPSMKPPPKFLRTHTSQPKASLRDKMITPSPAVPPKSPTKVENLPRFARDTASSRIAREQKLGAVPRPRADGPLMPRTNWAAQVAARTPHASPTTNRATRKGPQLVTHMGKENIRHFQEDAAKKGMHWNAAMCRWEGNENAVIDFDPPAPPSPPRPALITNITGAQGVQVVGGMVFDPQKMCWLKLGANPSDPMSPSVGDDDDPFRDIEDLHDTPPATATANAGPGGAISAGTVTGDWLVGEEFDLGPEFIKRQRDEEEIWRERVKAWFGDDRERSGEGYKWAIRDITATAMM